jgi:opacity protein-like surface antigen
MELPFVIKRLLPRRAASALALYALAAAGANTATAASNQNDFYAGVAVGAAAVAPRGFDVDKKGAAEGGTSNMLFVGARLTDIKLGGGLPLFIELGYQNISSHKVTYRVGGTTSQLTAKGRSVYGASKLDIPFNDRFGMFLRLGLARNSVDGSTPIGAPVIDIDGKKTGLLTGVGLQWHLSSSFTLRGDITSYGKMSKNSDSGALNLGVAYRF